MHSRGKLPVLATASIEPRKRRISLLEPDGPVNGTASAAQICPKSLFIKGFLVVLQLFPDMGRRLSASGFNALTILPFLKEEDSYRTQRVPRWVPAAGPIRAGLTSQPICASPALAYSTNLVFQCKNSGYRSCRESTAQRIRSLHPALKDGAFQR
jgi:hypothetical protein